MKKNIKIIAGVVTSGVFALIGGTKIFEKYKYDENGFDKEGFNKEGFNKEGFNKNGLNKNGYDINGYDYFGFNKYGYNKEGIDNAGNSFSTYAKIAAELRTNHTKVEKYISKKQFEDARFLLSKSFELFYATLWQHAQTSPYIGRYYSFKDITEKAVYCNPCTKFSDDEYNEIDHAYNLVFANHKLASNQFVFANRILGKLPNILRTKTTDYSK